MEHMEDYTLLSPEQLLKVAEDLRDERDTLKVERDVLRDERDRLRRGVRNDMQQFCEHSAPDFAPLGGNRPDCAVASVAAVSLSDAAFNSVTVGSLVGNPLPPDVFACAAGILCAPVIIDDEMGYHEECVVCTRQGPARILSARLRMLDEDWLERSPACYCSEDSSAYPWSNEATQVSDKDVWQDNEYRSVSLKFELPDDVFVMPNRFLHKAPGLKSVDLRSTRLTRLGNECLAASSRFLAHVHLPTTVTSIGDSFLAFDYYESPSVCFRSLDLRHLVGLKSIGSSFVARCTSLTELHLPASVETIRGDFLCDCGSLESLNLQHLTGLTSLAGTFMSFCESLTELQLPSSITSVDENFHQGSISGRFRFRSMDLRHTGLTSLGEYFMYTGSVSELQLPVSISEIGRNFLSWSRIIETLDLRHLTGLTSLNDNFMSCSRSLTVVQLPASITEINRCFLEQCPKITSIDLRHLTGLTSLGKDFAAGCDSLKEVYLPNSMADAELPEGFLEGCKLNPACYRVVDVRALKRSRDNS